MRPLNPDRDTAKAYAETNGYFWLPCPRCGTEFGGHEWDTPTAIECRVYPNTGHGTCGQCGFGSDAEEAAACARLHAERDRIAKLEAEVKELRER